MAIASNNNKKHNKGNTFDKYIELLNYHTMKLFPIEE